MLFFVGCDSKNTNKNTNDNSGNENVVESPKEGENNEVDSNDSIPNIEPELPNEDVNDGWTSPH